MIILIDDDSISGPLGEHLGVIAQTLAAMRLGNHRVLVSPNARRQLEQISPELATYPEWGVIQAGWVEGQAAARNASRIVALTDDPTRSGSVVENRYYVHLAEVEACGILREPSFVMENMSTDARLLKSYMSVLLQMQPLDLGRVWHAKAEQGGGSTIATFVKRHHDEPNPIVLMLDRDGVGAPPKNSTADKCFEALVEHGVFNTKSEAFGGGFSNVKANIAVHTLNAWAIENFVFPHVMELFFVNIAPENGHGDTSRRLPLVAKFPNFPVLNDLEAQEWLTLPFRKSPLHAGANIFDSNCINRLLNWAEEARENKSAFLHAVKISLASTPFETALSAAVKDVWSVGQRLRSFN